MINFRISDKVVCVDDVFIREKLLNKGSVYVVRGFSDIYCLSGKTGIFSFGVLIVGVINDKDFGVDIGFCPSRFRLLSEVKAENAAKAGRKAGV